LTRWPAVLAVLLAGIASAAQVGKVPAAMTTIGAEFGLGLGGAATLVGLFGLLAALGGLAIGLAAARIGRAAGAAGGGGHRHGSGAGRGRGADRPAAHGSEDRGRARAFC
jgi:hypothetical protein